jgi:hypothetical protein
MRAYEKVKIKNILFVTPPPAAVWEMDEREIVSTFGSMQQGSPSYQGEKEAFQFSTCHDFEDPGA